MINILYIINSLAHGGTEKQLVQLVTNLDKSQFHPFVATLYPSTALLQTSDIISIQLSFKSFADIEFPKTLLRLHRFVREQSIAIIQTFFQDPHLLGAILKSFLPIKLIGSFRDMGFWRTLSGTTKIRLTDFLYDGYISNSEAVKGYSSRSFGIRPNKITCIYNGFTIGNSFWETPRTSSDHSEYKVVGIVANLNRKVKRVEDFVKMAFLIKSRMPGVRFAVLGDGHLKESLIKLSNQCGLGGSISFLGSVPDPIKYVADFAVGVLTSESEGFSNAIIEYMACGIPVVATDVGGNPEIITAGENGYLVPTGNPSLMAEKVLFLLENPSLARTIGLTNREKVVRNYTVDRMVTQHQEYYRSISS